jgi:hypothetical protein
MENLGGEFLIFVGSGRGCLLFLLAMEPLHMLFRLAQEIGTLAFLHKNYENFRMSLYADNVALFINPTTQNFVTTKHIRHLFGEASGSVTNLEKTKLFPIRCDNINMEEVLGTG